nr:hypothetical protein [Tanacetum cinerariifolium]
MMLGEYIASAPLTQLVKPGGGIRSICLVSKVSSIMVVYSLECYLDDPQFSVGVSRVGEAILHAVNHMVEDHGDDVFLSMLLVDFQNAFNLVDRKVMLEEVHLRCLAISRWVKFCYSSPARLYYEEHTLWSCQEAWYLDDITIVGDTLVVGKVLELIKKDDFDFSSELVMKRVSKTIVLMDAVAKINDPQCQVLAAGNGDSPPYPLPFGGLGIYSACDVLNYAFLCKKKAISTQDWKSATKAGSA